MFLFLFYFEKVRETTACLLGDQWEGETERAGVRKKKHEWLESGRMKGDTGLLGCEDNPSCYVF